jgi:hypothetical protein
MPDIKKRTIKACAFDLGNTLINDTQLSKAATVDMGQWLFDKSLIKSKKPSANWNFLKRPLKN